MMILVNHNLILKIGFACLVIGNSSALTSWGINNIFEVLAYLILVILMLKKTGNNIKMPKTRWLFIMFVSVMFLIGLCIQDLDFNIKVRLIVSMLLIIVFFFMPRYAFREKHYIGDISVGLILGIVIDFILSIIAGEDLFSFATEGIGVDFGFNGGLQHKNYYGITCLVVFMCSYIYTKINFSKMQRYVMWVSIIGMLVSNSRTVYLLLIIFLLLANLNLPMRNFKHKKFLAYYILLILSVGIFIVLYVLYIQKSDSLLIRYSGFYNYLEYIDDYYNLIFGYAEIGFSNSDISYEEAVRSVVGWDGTTELSYLSILLKNGILGIIGYLMAFVDKFKIAIFQPDYKLYSLAVFTVMFFSSFVENYIANFHIAFMPAVLCVLGILGNDA